jgi:hypothetical protein
VSRNQAPVKQPIWTGSKQGICNPIRPYHAVPKTSQSALPAVDFSSSIPSGGRGPHVGPPREGSIQIVVTNGLCSVSILNYWLHLIASKVPKGCLIRFLEFHNSSNLGACIFKTNSFSGGNINYFHRPIPQPNPLKFHLKLKT